ncbi:hypothetical protein ACVR0O_00585 [Streptococcus caviae]|uniref:hypothetical protein n=1 Tax=Streptococcus sp. 'caviae' TaxID=1915004 RepID=UPI00094B9601|nr:hypothetical protein [Streptococcus sp. 'caviae']OLN84761.1 hypothetical protein BMI76_01390 [Streptococcus sp. 'caviae']
MKISGHTIIICLLYVISMSILVFIPKWFPSENIELITFLIGLVASLIMIAVYGKYFLQVLRDLKSHK